MITRELLERHCVRTADHMTKRQAFDACDALGAYSRWWLTPAVRAKAATYDNCYPDLTGDAPDCLTEPGVCNVLLVRDPKEYPVLEPAFLLPVRWRRGGHSGLPSKLTERADFVLGQFKETGWGLEPALARGLADDLGWMFDSAWAALAGGLVLAKDALHSQRGVFASAGWDAAYGAKSVGEIVSKQAAALRHGGRVLAVAPGQFETARAAGPDVIALNSGTNPRTVLLPYLAELGAPPHIDPDAADVGDQFDRGVAYYKLLPFRSEAHRAYYFDQLLPVVRDRLREHARPNLTDPPPTALAVVVSDGWELVPVLAAAFNVKRVLLLHTGHYARFLPKVRGRLAEQGICGDAVVPGPDSSDEVERPGLFSTATMRRDLTAQLTWFAGDNPGGLVVDVTLGTALMTLTLEQILRHNFPTSRLAYVAHRTPDGRLEPGREYPLIWRANDEMPELPPDQAEL